MRNGIDGARPARSRPSAKRARPPTNGRTTPSRSMSPPTTTIPNSDPTRNAEKTRPYRSSPPRSRATMTAAVPTASASAATRVMVRTRPRVRDRRAGDHSPPSSAGTGPRWTARLSGWASSSGETSSEIGRSDGSGTEGVCPGSVATRRLPRMKIGVVLPIGSGDGPDGGAPRWADLLAMARATEDHGLDSGWIADHFFYRAPNGAESGTHEAWTALSAAAAATSRIELGPIVLCASFRNPALTARMAATLDDISGGRLVLGVGCGWH